MTKTEGRLVRITGVTRSQEPVYLAREPGFRPHRLVARAVGTGGGDVQSVFRQVRERAVSDGSSGARDPDVMARRPQATDMSRPHPELSSFRLGKRSRA